MFRLNQNSQSCVSLSSCIQKRVDGAFPFLMQQAEKYADGCATWDAHISWDAMRNLNCTFILET